LRRPGQQRAALLQRPDDRLVGPDKAEFAFIDLKSGERWMVRINDGVIPWWLFDANSAAAYRWLLAAYSAALVVASLALREPAPRHAEVLIDAGGLAVAAIPLVLNPWTFFFGGASLPGIWEVVLLGAGFGLVAFGALDRSPGPAYLGVLNLVLFILAVNESDTATLYWWPLLLIAGGAFMLLAGLRPRRPLPPEPAPYRAGEAPLAARAEDEDIVVRVRDDS